MQTAEAVRSQLLITKWAFLVFLSDFPPPPPPPPAEDDLPAPPPECQSLPGASDAPPPAFPAPPPVADDLPLPAPPEENVCLPTSPSPPPPPPPPPLPASGTSVPSAAGTPQVSHDENLHCGCSACLHAPRTHCVSPRCVTDPPDIIVAGPR